MRSLTIFRSLRTMAAAVIAGVLLATLTPAIAPPQEAAADSGSSVTARVAVNIRTGAGTEHARIGVLYPGQSVQVRGTTSGGWTPVTFQGRDGWVSSEYVRSAGTRTPSNPPTPAPSQPTGSCVASYYNTGAITANGESYNPMGITAAHRSLPFNTRVRVTNNSNGKSVVVRINDRGPFISGRCLDLSQGAFQQISPLSAGLANVTYEVLS